MRIIEIEDLESNRALYDEICDVLEKGGLVCLPCNASYRIVADLTSEQAVLRLLQSKRRTQRKPALVFVEDESMLERVVEEIDPLARKLAQRYWPGSVTILFRAHPDLPARAIRELGKKRGKIGVRVPAHPVAREVVGRLGRPLLVSSANPETKKGAGSPAQIRKNFLGRIDLFIDAGDLPDGTASTVVEVERGRAKVTRAGAVDLAEIERLADG
ncbi:MAG: threonylcarbamoyl-AMP synthase [Deltaproteobacteria bacterium]|nr:threonylcarbamoyl-AMP synthase [Deltaproteobacteria bacterium]